jgi:transposase
MEQKKNRRRYDPEFKREAVLTVLNEGRQVKDVAEGLGIKPEILGRWRREYLARRGGGLTEQETEVQQLRKELEKTQRERDILKKALAIFSKNP